MAKPSPTIVTVLANLHCDQDALVVSCTCVVFVATADTRWQLQVVVSAESVNCPKRYVCKVIQSLSFLKIETCMYVPI